MKKKKKKERNVKRERWLRSLVKLFYFYCLYLWMCYISDILENWCRVTVSYMCKYIYKYLLINNLGGYIEKQFGIILFIQKEIFIIN